jgi:methionine-rich copper-binding protein CopC
MKRVVLGLLLIASLLACGGGNGVTPQGNGNGGPDTTAPTLTSSSPANNASSVAVNSNIQLVFSEKMDTASVSVTSDPNSDLGSATWDATGMQLSFNPPANLEVSSDYTLTVVGKDVAGNALAASSIKFTTASDSNPLPPVDTTAPTIASSSPEDGSTNAAINSNILVTFSEAMNPGSVTVSLNPSVNLGAPSFKSENSAVEFNPPADLSGNTSYTVTVTGKDVAGNALTGSSSFTFKTNTIKDTTAPATPKNPAAYADDAVVSVGWDPNTETDLKGYTVYYGTDANNLSRNKFFSKTSSEELNKKKVGTLYGGIITQLINGTKYFFAVDAEDGAGNHSGRSSVVNATPKDVTAPRLLSSTPRNGATGVLTTSNIVFNFSETMNPSTSTFGLDCIHGSGGCPTHWEAAWSNANKTVTFSNLLAHGLHKGATYRAFINARDLNGNLFSQLFSFVVEAERDPPTVVSATPDAFATGLPATVVLQIKFSEPMDRASVEAAFKANFTTGGAPITGAYTWNNDDTTVTLQPNTPLPYGENVNWALNPGAKDLAGNALLGTFGRIMRVIQQVTFNAPVLGSGHIVHACALNGSNCNDTAYTNESVIRVGDRKLDASTRPMQYSRIYLGFKIDTIPGNATVTAARLQVIHQATVGDPFVNLGNLLLERVNPPQTPGQPYQLSGNRGDFNLPALACGGCPQEIVVAPVFQDVIEYVRADQASGTGLSQFRLRFSPNEYATQTASDYIDYSKEPILTVTYQFP